jgi:peptidoglycan/xylan/chitin deacetylase (PgdA/CDA1 family)
MTRQLSVIVLRRTAGGDLGACLAALRASTAAVDAEVIVVGQPPVDGLEPLEEGVHWLAQDAGDPARAWNQGAATATGITLLFMGAEVIADPMLLARHVTAHATGRSIVGLGQVAPGRDAHGLAELRHQAEPDDVPALFECVGQVLSIPAAAFRRVGGFTPGVAWGGEIELVYRLQRDGLVLCRLEGWAGRRAIPLDAGQVVEERVRAGRGSVELYRRAPALLPELELGRCHGNQSPGVSLRRALLAVGAPPLPSALARLPLPAPLMPRWYRFLYEYCFWRGVRQAFGPDQRWRAFLRPPVILMYHGVGAIGESPGCYVVPVARFRRQMAWLHWRRYRVIGLEELLEHRRRHEPPPARSVVITFDDGYADNRRLALPVLRARGYRATFFLVSAHLGGSNLWDTDGELAGRPLLSQDDARAMLEVGMEIGAHTRTHPVLPDLSDAEAEREVGGAREELEAVLGRPVRTFAYPYGRLNPSTTAAVIRSGYEAACCSRSGVNDPAVQPFLLRRVEVRGTDSLARFILATHRGWVSRRGPR